MTPAGCLPVRRPPLSQPPHLVVGTYGSRAEADEEIPSTLELRHLIHPHQVRSDDDNDAYKMTPPFLLIPPTCHSLVFHVREPEMSGTPKQRSGSCLCGKVRYSISDKHGPDMTQLMCHCPNCLKSLGNSGAFTFCPRDVRPPETSPQVVSFVRTHPQVTSNPTS